FIEGPIEVRDSSTTVILADQAELSDGLRNGILKGARLVLDQQVQIAAVELQRIDGRFSQGYRVAATSCHVCDNGRSPLWQIRARRVVHDELEQQLYFDDAQFRILGVPVLYTPRLRLPDPNLDRATGLLTPQLVSSSLLGWGAKLPYFVKLGDHADLTFTPYLTNQTTTLETRLRRAFVNGDINGTLYLSRDDIREEGDTRWGVLAIGSFALARGYQLSFDIEEASDRSYLSDYAYSDKDRLDTAIGIRRTLIDQDFSAELVRIQSLRDGEDTNTFPSLLFGTDYDRRLGRHGLISLSASGYLRPSELSNDSDGDGLGDGIDGSRLGAALTWGRSDHIGGGFVLESKAEAAADLFFISDDDQFDSTVSRASGGAAIGLRWPLQRRMETGAVHIIEPRVQLAYSTASSAELPNQDSTRVEFDEGNLFALNRAPGADVIEDGGRLEFGVNWTRMGSGGWNSTLTIGRIERFSGSNSFTDASGLSGDASNWLVSGSLIAGPHFDIIGRILLDDTLAVVKNEVRGRYKEENFHIGAAYAYLIADDAEDRSTSASEMVIDTSYRFNERVASSAFLRY
ncbi:MAG: LPS assembly protein LptD, partial [Pseudomonadota bacterium]